MPSAELEIRAFIVDWSLAVGDRDVMRLLPLVAESAIFVRPGKMALGKRELEGLSKVASEPCGPPSSVNVEIRELRIQGDAAFMWSTVRIEQSSGDKRVAVLEGQTLSVMRREAGAWFLWSDSNLLLAALFPTSRMSAVTG